MDYLSISLQKNHLNCHIAMNASPQPDISFILHSRNTIFASILITKSLLQEKYRDKGSWLDKKVVNFLIELYFCLQTWYVVFLCLFLVFVFFLFLSMCTCVCVIAVFPSFKWKLIFLFKLIFVVAMNERWERKKRTTLPYLFSLPMATVLKIHLQTLQTVYFVLFSNICCHFSSVLHRKWLLNE